MGKSEEQRGHVETARELRFGRFCLHPSRGLTRGTTEVRVTPKSLAVLYLLAQRAGEVVSKEDLFHSVWPGTAVSDAALTSCIQELRRALGDNARRPRFIETLHRRGYRFIARTHSPQPETVALSPRALQPDDEAPVVGRGAVLEAMREAYAAAEAGARQVLFVSGEPGIGKTAVVAEFVTRIARDMGATTASGQCLEHYGAYEPYQPILDALTRLCRQGNTSDVIPLLQQHAPSWVAQLPAALFPARSTRRVPAGTTPERMLRELNDALEAISLRRPLLLWIEDLHWSDPSTLDWVGAFAARPEPARVLLVATFRSADAADTTHPLRELAVRLRVKRLCREIALEGLDEAAVTEYIGSRYPAAAGSSDRHAHLARIVHERTGGNPLFVSTVLSDLARRGVLVRRDGAWTTEGVVQASDLVVPDDIRLMIERQIECLPSTDQRVLEIASVAGATFSSAAVAAGGHLSLGEVEPRLAALARGHRFLRQADPIEWPDGTVAAGFAFLHALYREVLYQRIPAGYRAELHREIGTCEERAYGSRAAEIAAELAMHFEAGRDAERAIACFQQAADNARRRNAYKEARLQYERALALVPRIADARQRTETELPLRIGLGGVIVAMQGWAARDVEDTYLRAQALCRELGETPRLFPALWGLWLFHWGRGTLDAAEDLSSRLLAVAEQSGERTLRLQAHHAAWATTFSRGDFKAAQRHAASGQTMYDATQDTALAAVYGGHDACACAHQFSARALAFLGRTGEAVEQSHESIRHAAALGDPFSLAIAHVFAAAVDHARRDPASTREHVLAATRIAEDQDFRLLQAWASVFAGWAKVEEGCCEEGLRQIQQGVTDALATGSKQFVSHFLGILAESRLRAGAYDEGLRAIDEALDLVRQTGERFYEAELHRLRGELLLGASPAGAVREADEAFSHALTIAQQQAATLLIVRSAVSRARLWQRLGRRDEAHQLLQTACADADEADGNTELAEVKALLAQT
jgi:DNA-binding winged helix-turn-helix (wHTH) protein/predicted ATPase